MSHSICSSWLINLHNGIFAHDFVHVASHVKSVPGDYMEREWAIVLGNWKFIAKVIL